MRHSFFVLATCLVVACGSRDPECGSTTGLIVVGGRCVCPMGTRYVCDETSENCACEPVVDAGPSDAGVPGDGSTSADCAAEGEMMCGTTCVDTRTSMEHCGACDAACAAPDRCLDARCVDPVLDVEVGGTHACALRASGSVVCWGANESGQLGDGTTIERHEPTRVVGVDDAVQLSLGGIDPFGRGEGTSSCARRITGGVVCWGYITGDGTLGTELPRPTDVAGIADAVDVSVGGGHACAVRAGGTVACWGANPQGQLGNGATASVPSSEPVSVLGITTARAVSAGLTHTCAVLEDMSIRCWGAGTAGQLGNGLAVDSSTPVTVESIDDAAQVSAGIGCSCARRAAGEVLCWGDNASGCLGREAGRTASPFPITGPRDFALLSEGDLGQQCGLRADGRVVCWGVIDGQSANDAGMPVVAVPIERETLLGATDIAPSRLFECAVYDDARVSCRGRNRFGQLGDGTTEDRESPVMVVGLP